MRAANVTAGSGRLVHDVKALRARWELACERWSDDNARRFEAEHIAPLEARAESALRAMHDLADVLARLGRDLEA